MRIVEPLIRRGGFDNFAVFGVWRLVFGIALIPIFIGLAYHNIAEKSHKWQSFCATH